MNYSNTPSNRNWLQHLLDSRAGLKALSLAPLMVMLLINGCASHARGCYTPANDDEWLRLDAAPEGIDNKFLEKLFNRKNQPDAAQIAWYQRSPTEFRACVAPVRNSHGCGDHVVDVAIVNGKPSKTGNESITVC